MATGDAYLIRWQRERETMQRRIHRCAWDTEAIDRHNELSRLIGQAKQPATVISLLDWKTNR